jgi:hypothetical protein
MGKAIEGQEAIGTCVNFIHFDLHDPQVEGVTYVSTIGDFLKSTKTKQVMKSQ